MRTILFLTLSAKALVTSGCAGRLERAYAGERLGRESGRRSMNSTARASPSLIPGSPETREGVTMVSLGFRDAAEGEVSEDVAHRANIWFRRYADSNRDMRITDDEIRIALVAAAGRFTTLAFRIGDRDHLIFLRRRRAGGRCARRRPPRRGSPARAAIRGRSGRHRRRSRPRRPGSRSARSSSSSASVTVAPKQTRLRSACAPGSMTLAAFIRRERKPIRRSISRSRLRPY